MTELRRDKLDAQAMHQRLTADGSRWEKPTTVVIAGAEAADTWLIQGVGYRIIVSYDPDSEPGVEWVHASISHANPQRIPSYNDLKRLHHGVFGDGHAYQAFVPAAEHISIRNNVLHLWGRLDGKPVLPDFGRLGTI